MLKKNLKTGTEMRHDAQARMKKYRAGMIEKGYTSTTVFLSKEHRTELKRLGEEHDFTRAQAAEHIFQVYLKSDDKSVIKTVSYNNNTDVSNNINTNREQQTKTLALIESIEARLKAIEDKEPEPNNPINKIISNDVNTNAENQTEISAIIDPLKDAMSDNTNKAIEDAINKAMDDMPDIKPIKELEGFKESISTMVKRAIKTKVKKAMEDRPGIKPIKETQNEIEFEILTEPVEDNPHVSVKPTSEQDDGIDLIDLPGYLLNIIPDMPVEERHEIVLRLANDFPGRNNAQTRLDLLNTAGILLGGKPWETAKQFGDQLSLARRWQAKKKAKK